MAIKGKKLNSNLVMFGEPLNERAKTALERSSPTADQIIQSLPPSAFIPVPELSKKEKVAIEEKRKDEIEKEKVVNAQEARKSRLQKKKELAMKKRKERQAKKSTKTKPTKEKDEVVETTTIIENLVESNTSIEPIAEKSNMNLEEELKSLEETLEPKVEEPVVTQREVDEPTPQADLKDQILELLEGEENPPSLDLISSWKESYGKNGIHVMAFGEGDVYIYHHLTRGEWKKIKEIMNKMRESQNQDEVEEKLKEKVVLYCVLWPSLDERWLEYCKAGILDSLYQMILLNSGFLTPQQSMLLTTQL